MSEYSDEDYEVSNPVLNEYLNNFDELKPKLEKENPTPNLDSKNSIDEPISPQIASKKNTKFYFLSYFHDKNYLTHLLSHNTARIDQIMAKPDKNLVFDSYMTYLELINEHRNTKFFYLIKSFVTKNVSLLFFSILIYFIYSIYFNDFYTMFYIFSLFLFSVFALFFINFKLFELFVSCSLIMFQNYLNLAKNLIYYLKEVELVSLANKRRYFIEKSSNTSSNIDVDNLNYPFRKHTFKKFKEQFFDLKRLNKNTLEFNSKQDSLSLDDFDLICTIKDNELSEIMWKHDDDLLDGLTDNFSIGCIKSVIKLNRMLVSESFKLILISYLNLILSDFSIVKLVKVLAEFDLRLIKTYFLIKKFINEVEGLNKICNLVDLNENAKETGTKTTTIAQQISLEHNLSVHLRNAFLNVCHLEKIEDTKSEAKLETLKLLKYSFEYCDLYYKKLISEIEGETDKQTNEDKIDIDNQAKSKSDEESNAKQAEPVVMAPVEDEIFEADTSSLVEQVQITTTDSDYLFKEKQNEMANKNLFYELKFALKSKKNEWEQREKKAKKIVDGKMVKEEADKENAVKAGENEEYNLNTDYLLDNEALKYKSTLRKRKFGKSIDKELENEIDLSENKKNKYKYIENEEKVKPSFGITGNNGLLNELLKHKLFSQNEEIFE